MRRSALLPLAVAALLLSAATALAVTGQLTQLAGTAGCVSETGTGGQCANGRALVGAHSVAVSPDGTSAYAVANVSDAVAVFQRDATTGELTQPGGTGGCVSETGSGGSCADGKGLEAAVSVVVSPDGKNVYVASESSDGAVAVFRRDATTGALTQPAGTGGCVSETGSGGSCADGKALMLPESVVVSADGKSVYVASAESSAVAVFRRNATTGALFQPPGLAGCVSETGSAGTCADGKALDGADSLAVSADGKSVYVASFSGDAVAVLRRNTTNGNLTQLVGPAGTAGCVSETGTGGQCADGKALGAPNSVAVSPNGKSVYVASAGSDAVAAFRRDTTTGVITQLVGPAEKAGCVSETGTGGQCADGKALDLPESVAVSGDGRSLYVASQFSDAIAVFRRSTTNGALQQLAGTAGCVSETGTGGQCADGKALDGPVSVAVSTDGGSVYVTSFGSTAVAAFDREFPPGADHTPPEFTGLDSATTCIPGPIGGGTTSSYHLGWDPATDDVTPSGEIVYDVYQATMPGGEDFSAPTYTTSAGATSFDTPPLTSDKSYYFVVRARDAAGNRDSNLAERAGENLCV